MNNQSKDIIRETHYIKIGKSRTIRKVHKWINYLAKKQVDPTIVLISGETGVGKEVVARLLHQKLEIGGAFVAVNTTAISKDLFESELFGHAKGAFTGARDATEGYFYQAKHGALFLDEIGEPLSQMYKNTNSYDNSEVYLKGKINNILPLAPARFHSWSNWIIHKPWWMA